MAVKAFFVVSGFFIFMSYERSTSLASYVRKRVRRIYPAYFTVVCLCAVGLYFVSNLDLAEYLSPEWLKYLAANLTFLNFLHPTLPGVFEQNHTHAINGALWTLKIEVLFYISVPFFVYLFRRYSHLKIIFLVIVLSIGYRELMEAIGSQPGYGMFVEMSRQLPGQLSYFFSGALLYYFFSFFKKYFYAFLPASIIILGLDQHLSTLSLFEPLALGIFIVGIGTSFFLGSFGKHGDFSYGIYIIHFPTIQILLNSGYFSDHPTLLLPAVLAITGIGAFALWNLIEKKFLTGRGEKVHNPSEAELDNKPTILG